MQAKSRISKISPIKQEPVSLPDIKCDAKYLDIMHNLCNNGYETRIAGGYPRDLIFQRKYKDVDFFIQISKECDHSYFVEVILPEALDSVGIENDLHQSYMGYSEFSTTFSVWNCKELQFILINYHIDNIFSYFDYSINQVGFKPDGGLYHSESFLHTHSTKEIIKIRPVSANRDDYIKSKFPEFILKNKRSSSLKAKKIKAPQFDNLNISFDDFVTNNYTWTTAAIPVTELNPSTETPPFPIEQNT